MSVTYYYKNAFEENLNFIKNYKNGDEEPLLEHLLEFCRNLKIDLRTDLERIAHDEEVRELKETGEYYDYHYFPTLE
jgi:hypothetical protein